MSILACFFLALIPSVASITFNFPSISQNNSQDIILSGDAYTSDDGIEVTYNRNIGRSSEWLAGRVTYGRRSIGLPFNFTTDTSVYPFVAVEFDSYGTNSWDPKDLDTGNFIDDHVGININSITSSLSRKWFTNMTYGEEYGALINYHSDSKNLSVSFTSLKNNSLVWETGLDYTIDLRDVLPEWVIFGFSVSTGDWKKNNGDKVEELGYALEMNGEFEMGATMPRRFSYLELARSTAHFAETEKLGEGGFGGVYKVCGRKPTEYMDEENQIRLLEWVWELYGSGTLLKSVDPLLGSDLVEEEVKRLIIVGLWCVHTDSEFRPSIRQVINVLNSEASLPLLPSKMPMASYFATPTSSPCDFSPLVQYQSSSSTSFNTLN
ncbi:hypothetical protein L1987_55186 [Smallanthus sonchifolius]|uniref:Uncharacterized protein n=1 Tax=Smallanthus sonchifolius TaxID=185202 RepID=A0ACB9E8Z9_9ASTR|nr:hypothetical protein L1987_55186 [Smallanthus sonchifolius]